MIDLQLHTTDSDGTWAWDRVLEACLSMGLSAFAITDHDTVVRHAEIRAWAKGKKPLVIPGVELSTKENNQTVHLLGYFCEGPLDRLEERLKFLNAARADRNTLILGKLRKLGFDVTEDDLKRVAGKATVGRPHLARVLLEKGYVGTIREAFDRFLAAGAAAYVEKEEMPLRDGIEILHSAGAVTSVAHPILLNRTPDELETSLKLWRSWGLDGLEGIYPTYKPEQTQFMARMAGKYGFLITGGSDFHGENKPHIRIGVGLGTLSVPDDLIAPLVERKEEVMRKIHQNERIES
jgi:predicted metal-dependent phosphoesterase TrpH